MVNTPHTSLDSRSEVISAISSFLAEIRRDAGRYTYISLMEGHFLDFFCTIFPNRPDSADDLGASLRGKLFSNNGLLLQHQALAGYYRKNGSFPPILIVDGLVDHGRNIAKFLSQLENAIAEDIHSQEGKLLPDDEQRSLYYHLTEAINIRIFARSRNPLLLSDGYIMNTECSHKLYGVQMQRVADMLFMSYFPKTATPNFALSVCLGDQISISFAKSEPWEYVPWCGGQGRNLHAYIRPYMSKSDTYLIQTVRFYGDQPTLLTSYSLLPDLDMNPSGNFSWICDDLCSALADPQYNPLRRILADKAPYAQQGRGRLISVLLSIGGLIDFCENYGLSAMELLKTADLSKLALTFSPDSSPAFSALLSAPALCRRVSDWIRAGLRRGNAKMVFQEKQEEVFPIYSSSIRKKDYLLFLFGMEDAFSYEASHDILDNLCTQAKDSIGERRQSILDHIRAMTGESRGGDIARIALSEDFSHVPVDKLDAHRVAAFINNELERDLYLRGMSSEANAHCFFDSPFLYKPNLFEEYDPYALSGNPSNILSLPDFMALCPNLPVSGYGRVAAYLSLLDRGCIASDFQCVEGETTMYPVCTIGRTALSYLPRKLSLFIPALSYAEKNAPFLNLSSRDSVLRFVRKYLNYDGERREIATGLFELKLNIQDYMNIIEQAGHAFAGWNFEALTKQLDPVHAKAQEDFLSQAQKFIVAQDVF